MSRAAKPMRGLVPVEILAFIAIAFAPWPEAVPIALPLFVVSSISIWVRSRSWNDALTLDSTQAVVGIIVGCASVGIAVIAGGPIVGALLGKTVQWSTDPIVRGNMTALGGSIILAAITALCLELALRGWIVERVLELSGDRADARIIAVLLGATAEALITPGHIETRIGGALFGIGLGWLYVAGKRNVLAPMMARMTFGVVAVLLQAFKAIG